MLAPLLAAILSAAVQPYGGLPQDARILEERALPGERNRSLLLWIVASPDLKLIPSTSGEEAHTCPEQTMGDHHTAPTRVSLIDTHAKRVINTVPVKLGAADEFDIAVAVQPGNAYKVPGPLVKTVGKPKILDLHDFNNDGKALEFAFYVKENCNGPLTMLMGYSTRQDRVIAYEFLIENLTSREKAKPELWTYDFTRQRPVSRMRWRYTDYYNSGLQLSYEIHFDPVRERFEGIVRTRK